MSKKTKPIKRSPALVEFSKDHHFGLLLVWKIRQGQRAGIPPVRIAQYVTYFYEQDLQHHFADEEKFLFPTLHEHNSLRQRAEREHAEIRGLVSSIRHFPFDPEWLKSFAELLEAHIRFEERELFNQLQTLMSEAELLKLLKEVPARPHLEDEKWRDRFWERKPKEITAENRS
ncbi:hemerythrin domain-containing protein [Nafulsella turpanensis]|uniref:hemerythrin domain-containing protein n=1 Tax=Nafulsella turpanensis TaxID=1265690 RepID=UPI00034BC508|nr:hemerythrin domain-containing protein [Nafulsella turpanensis]